MRKALTIFAAGATLTAAAVSATSARAAQIDSGPRAVAGPCTAGTWVQTPANVTSAMVNGNLLADTIVSSTDAWAVGFYDSWADTWFALGELDRRVELERDHEWRAQRGARRRDQLRS